MMTLEQVRDWHREMQRHAPKHKEAADAIDAEIQRQAVVPANGEAVPRIPRTMSSAPRDGSMLRLLVRFTEHATDDAEEAWTIGSNSFDANGEDVWQFAGWCWDHDHFTEGKGTPVGWLPFHDVPADVARDAVKVIRVARKPCLDPITIYVEDIHPSAGLATIACYNESWTCFWGAMGDRILLQFVASCDAPYVAGSMLSGRRRQTRHEQEYVERIAQAFIDAAMAEQRGGAE